MANFECPNCGNIVPESDRCCKYCGTANPNFSNPKKGFNNITSTLNSTFRSSNNSSSSSSASSAKSKKQFSVGIFVLLLIFFWPAAIIYLLVTTAS
ncbi:MAG: zinc ribbon domain-containing protein [Bacilli bacterium]|nr:zinc ribbon domain-containing protein [Bacilli bacterium]